MFDFSLITNWVHGLLTSWMPLGLAIFLECVIVGVCLLLLYAVIAIVMIFMERKVCAAFQCRLGPMRVGPWGTVQVFCDVIKMLTKEIITSWPRCWPSPACPWRAGWRSSTSTSASSS